MPLAVFFVTYKLALDGVKTVTVQDVGNWYKEGRISRIVTEGKLRMY
jgi:hypothetical protein